MSMLAYDWSTIIFSVIWLLFLFFISYNFFLSCFRRDANSRAPRPPPTGPRPSSSGGWFPGGMDDSQGPPPPYSKNPSEATGQGWRPGFWTGAALGGIANHLFANRRQAAAAPRPATWDWEREQPRASIFGGRRAATPARSDDRGEGSSNLGAMRRSTGLGGSSVRWFWRYFLVIACLAVILMTSSLARCFFSCLLGRNVIFSMLYLLYLLVSRFKMDFCPMFVRLTFAPAKS